AENVAVLEDDVADIDAHAEFDAFRSRHIGIASGHRALEIDSTTHRIDDAGEFDQQAIAAGFDGASVMFLDLGVAEVAADRLQCRECLPRPHPSAANTRRRPPPVSPPIYALRVPRSSGWAVSRKSATQGRIKVGRTRRTGFVPDTALKGRLGIS